MEVESPRGRLSSHSHDNGMKIVCTVHGPRALPRSSPFSPQLVLTTHVKYAPFATRHRRGYLRDSNERDLGIHLETALRGAIIADRWPKSGVDVIVTIIEGDQERRQPENSESEQWDMMNVLGGCITVASAALVDAGIDCVDLVSGGVAAVVVGHGAEEPSIVVDPVASEHGMVTAACCVAYLPSRDEITALWVKGQLPMSNSLEYTQLIGWAVQAAKGAHDVIVESLSTTAGTVA
jgi:exosome complex component MTR3